MKKILVLNNYSVSRVKLEIANQLKPSHHLYGIIELENAGYNIISVDPNQKSLIYKIGNIIAKIPFLNVGDLYQQWQAILHRKEYDIVYAPCQDSTILLGVLSYFRIYQKPIIALAHHPMLKGNLAKLRKHSLYFSIQGHFKFLALCNIIALELNAIAREKVSQEMNWGPELNYYNSQRALVKESSKIYDIIALGRTGRDYNTLIDAFTNTSVKVFICCSIELKSILKSDFTNNITIRWLKSHEELNYIDLIEMYLTAKILAIPMHNEDSLCGLTSITDAIALGMPIIITRNKYINIDPELNQFGFWVDAYDEISWRKLTDRILNNTTLFNEMSNNAQQIASTTFNSNIFSNSLIKIIQQI